MERYQRGHQQPVEGERPVGVLLVFACLTVAIAAVLWGLNAARQQRPGTAFDSGSDSAVASQEDEMRDADDSDVAVTADMLRAYREVPTAQLALSGYLDIKGNVWGAIVRDERGWVDMVTIAADAGDASCRLRAVRLSPQATDSKEGS